MTLATPALLWSLLALVPLAAVYLLKVRPRRRPTTAIFLWDRVLSDRRPNRLWDRLRNLVSLLMMAMAFAALSLAMAGPRWADTTPQDLLIVIDNSMSMNAGTNGRTRLDAAKRVASDLARILDGVQRAALATAAGRLRYGSYLTDNPRELLSAIDRVTSTIEPLAVELVPAAEELVDDDPISETGDDAASGNGTPRRVVLITDGAFDRGVLAEGVEVVTVGDQAANIGLVGADLRYTVEDGRRATFYYRVASTFDEPVPADLSLSWIGSGGERRLAKVIPLTVQPGENKPDIVTVDEAEPGRWLAELDTSAVPNGDALADDDRAFLVARRPTPITVSVATGDSYFLRRAVEAFADYGGGLDLVATGGEVTVGLGRVDDAERSIVFAPDGESPWWSELGASAPVTAPKETVENHPLLANIDALPIRFDGARRLTPPLGSEVIVESETGVPLIYYAARAGRSAVVVNLDPAEAEFYYSAWFPVIVRSAAGLLTGRTETLLSTYEPLDKPVLPMDAAGFRAELTTPSGDRLPLVGPMITGLVEAGFHAIDSGTESWTIACSALDAGETLLNGPSVDQEVVEITSGPALSPWLAVLALLAVTAESVLYHRRKVG